jgi:hypothetical protein
MPSKILRDLAPNTFDQNNSNSQSTRFSYVRTVYSRQYGGTVVPPTKTEFMRIWNSYDQEYEFFYQGDTLEECKHNLSVNVFPSIRHIITARNYTLAKQKAIAWTRMIMAFNMYANILREFNVSQNNYIDFIGSKTGYDIWKSMFHRRCVLFINNEKLQEMIELSNNISSIDLHSDHRRFWQNIFDIYDILPINRRFRTRTIPNGITIITQQVPIRTRGSRSSSINTEQEYLSREHEETDLVNLDNQQIANMIMNIENPLPDDVKKTIFDTCLALHISHAI